MSKFWFNSPVQLISNDSNISKKQNYNCCRCSFVLLLLLIIILTTVIIIIIIITIDYFHSAGAYYKIDIETIRVDWY